MHHLSLNQNSKKTFISGLFTPVPAFHQFSEKIKYMYISIREQKYKKIHTLDQKQPQNTLDLFSGQHKI